MATKILPDRFPNTLFQRQLAHLGACKEARAWVADKTFREAWEACEQVRWMWWLAGRVLADLVSLPAHTDGGPRCARCGMTRDELRAAITADAISAAYRKLPGAMLK